MSRLRGAASPAGCLPLIFLGPSLGRAEAEQICPGEYRPPIRRGDLRRLAGSPPRIIGIVDGVFLESLTVSPFEVLKTLASGHQVYGAASMGALRAVELAHAGMVGVGRVYDAYATGETERDDEVAVCFDPESGRALSEPLIGMRTALQEAAAAGLLTGEEAQKAIAIAARLHYPQRTYRLVLDRLELPPARQAPLLHFLQTEATDLKAEDARALLRRIATDMASDAGIRQANSIPGSWLCSAYRLAPRQGQPEARPTLAQLPPAPKVDGWTSVRTVTASETEANLAAVRSRIGITRIADITGLDTLGIPCYAAILPGSLLGTGVSAYSGKSLDPLEARVGAQMEALEAALVRDDRVAVRRARYTDLAGEGHVLDPERLPVVGGERRDLRTVEFDWVTGWNLRTGAATRVPADAVFFRHRPEPPWYLSSNGLASGNCLTEALAHALAELIERDAETLHLLATEYHHLPHTLRLLAGTARVPAPAGHGVAPDLAYPFVDLDTLPGPLHAAAGQIRQAGANVDLRWIASDIAVPVFQCLIYERQGSAVMLHAGSGAHPDAAVAARRALTEAVQTRATFIQGVREDLRGPAIRDQEAPTGGWFDPRVPRVGFADLPSHAFPDVMEDLRYMAAALEHAGLPEIIAVDISHPELPFSVARLIVPDLEAPLELSNRSRVALGWRARRLFEHRLKRVS